MIVCYYVIGRHQKQDSGCIQLKRKARKQRSPAPTSEVMCVDAHHVCYPFIEPCKAMFSTQERGPREEPYSEVPWDLMGESQERPEPGSSPDVCVSNGSWRVFQKIVCVAHTPG